ncbi:MAG: ribonuclease P protein component [Verrucomicrobia bacterium]|nr:ribonuclease P protein component [Verrucomicrobiota bacterium]
MRFPHNRRITQRREFSRVRSKGKTYRGHFMLMGVLQDDEVPDLKIGYITTRRLGNAVTRNRIRRRLRGIFQRLGGNLKKGYYLVVIPRASAAHASSEVLEKEWKWLIHQSGLYQEDQEEQNR